MLIGSRQVLLALAMVASVWVFTTAPAAADSSADVTADNAPLSSGQDCSKGCTDCQKDCHEARCMKACTAQWSGCCMTAGLKPPQMGSCACLN
jgi:hypothetical protein